MAPPHRFWKDHESLVSLMHRLTPAQIAVLSLVSRPLHGAATDDAVWRRLCVERFTRPVSKKASCSVGEVAVGVAAGSGGDPSPMHSLPPQFDTWRGFFRSAVPEVRAWAETHNSRGPLAPRYDVTGGHRGVIRCLALTDAETLVTGSADATLRVWDLSAGVLAPKRRLRPPTTRISAIVSLAVGATGGGDDGSGPTLITVNDERAVHMFDLAKAAPIETTFASHTGRVTAVCRTSTVSASVGTDGTLRVWRRGETEPLHVIQVSESPLLCAAGHNGCVVVGSKDGTVTMWDAEGTGKRVARLGRSARSRASSPAPPGEAAAESGGSVSGFDPKRGHTGPVTSVACCPTPGAFEVASGSSDGTVILWDLGKREAVAQMQCGAPVHCVAFDAVRVVAGLRTGEIVAFVRGTHEEMLRVKWHDRAVTSLAFNASGKLVSASPDGAAVLIDFGEIARAHVPSVAIPPNVGQPRFPKGKRRKVVRPAWRKKQPLPVQQRPGSSSAAAGSSRRPGSVSGAPTPSAAASRALSSRIREQSAHQQQNQAPGRLPGTPPPHGQQPQPRSISRPGSAPRVQVSTVAGGSGGNGNHGNHGNSNETTTRLPVPGRGCATAGGAASSPKPPTGPRPPSSGGARRFSPAPSPVPSPAPSPPPSEHSPGGSGAAADRSFSPMPPPAGKPRRPSVGRRSPSPAFSGGDMEGVLNALPSTPRGGVLPPLQVHQGTQQLEVPSTDGTTRRAPSPRVRQMLERQGLVDQQPKQHGKGNDSSSAIDNNDNDDNDDDDDDDDDDTNEEIAVGSAAMPMRSGRSDALVTPATAPAAAAPVVVLPRFCTECGEPFPKETTRFCIECGAARLKPAVAAAVKASRTSSELSSSLATLSNPGALPVVGPSGEGAQHAQQPAAVSAQTSSSSSLATTGVSTLSAGMATTMTGMPLGAPDDEVSRSLLTRTQASSVSFNVDISLPGSPSASPTNAARASRGGSSGSDAYVDVVNRKVRREGSGSMDNTADGGIGTIESMRRANEELRGMMSKAFDRKYTVLHFVLDIRFRFCGADLPGFALRWATSRDLIGSVEEERASGRRVVSSAQWVFLEPNDEPLQVEMRSRDDDDIDGMVSLDATVWDEIVYSAHVHFGDATSGEDAQNASFEPRLAIKGKRSREALVQLQREEDYLETGTGSRIDVRRSAALGDLGLDEASIRMFFHPNFVRSNGQRVDVIKDVEFVASVQDFPFATVAEDSEGWSRLVAKDDP